LLREGKPARRAELSADEAVRLMVGEWSVVTTSADPSTSLGMTRSGDPSTSLGMTRSANPSTSLGMTASAAERRAPRTVEKVALRVEDLSAGDRVRDVSFEVRRGEILGLSGLVGSGRTEMLRALFGADRPERGRVLAGDPLAPVRIRGPRDAVRAGIGLIPEDRKAHGLLLARSVSM
jgi:ribose transport system ATP-binding protein